MFNEAIYISFIAQPSVFVNQMCDWSEVTIQNVLKRAKYVTLRKKRKKDKNYSSAASSRWRTIQSKNRRQTSDGIVEVKS
jgi:hypothetical protein